MNTKIQLKAVLLGTLLVASSLHAESSSKENADDRSPLGCRNLGYQFKLKVLELIPDAAGERNSLYFLFNPLSKPVNLYNMLGKDSTYSTFLNQTIQPRQWAVLATNEKYLKYICTVNEGKSPYGKIVDCADSLKVCEYINVKFGMNNQGNFWLVKGNTAGGAVNEVLHYGIIPR